MSANADLAGKRMMDLASKSSGKPARLRRRWEASDTVIDICTGLVLIIVAIFTLLCVQGYATTIEATKTRGQAAADIVAEETRWMVASGLTLALGAAGAFNFDPEQANATTLQRFDNITKLMPTKTELGVYDPTGQLVRDASSPGVPVDIAGRDYFKAIAGGEDWALSAQEKDAVSGRATFAVARRIGPPGRFLGVTMIAIDAGVLESITAPQNLGAGSTISIVRKDGWVIARLPTLTAPLNLAGSDAFGQLRSGDPGSYLSPASPADGVARMVSFRHVNDLGYIAIASIALDTALAGLWTSIWIVSLLLAPIAVALIIGSLVTAGILRRSAKTQASLTAAVAHNDVLLREIHHRVKNNLQSVASLLQMQPIPREVKANMGQRIAAMSAVHEHIYRSSNFATVNVKTYLETLIANIRAGAGPDVKVDEQIEDIAVDKDAATPLGLIVNEVVANAFKHAFPESRTGTITIRFARDGEQNAVLTVEDDGIGFDPETPAKGIGRRLIAALTAQLDGESTAMTRQGGGSLFRLSFPLVQQG